MVSQSPQREFCQVFRRVRSRDLEAVSRWWVKSSFFSFRIVQISGLKVLRQWMIFQYQTWKVFYEIIFEQKVVRTGASTKICPKFYNNSGGRSSILVRLCYKKCFSINILDNVKLIRLSCLLLLIRELKQATTTTGTKTSLNKRFNKQNNICARAL